MKRQFASNTHIRGASSSMEWAKVQYVRVHTPNFPSMVRVVTLRQALVYLRNSGAFLTVSLRSARLAMRLNAFDLSVLFDCNQPFCVVSLLNFLCCSDRLNLSEQPNGKSFKGILTIVFSDEMTLGASVWKPSVSGLISEPAM